MHLIILNSTIRNIKVTSLLYHDSYKYHNIRLRYSEDMKKHQAHLMGKNVSVYPSKQF